MSKTIIEVRDLHRHFGDLHAVKGISFEISQGNVTGFIGANGSGKTTTMRMMVTLELPDSGTIRINDTDVVDSPYTIRRNVGWMPDAFGKYEMMTVFEYLDFFARAFGYVGKERRNRVDEVMEFTDLKWISDRYIDKLSKGMGQRLCLGRTLLHDPEVLILDEPAAGLDPKARIELRDLIRYLAEDGKTIFISSHILSELAEMCDSMLFIDEGELVHHGTAESMKKHDEFGTVVDVTLASEAERLEEWASLTPGVQLIDRRKNGGLLALDDADPSLIALTLKRMINDNLEVIEFKRDERKIEDAFIDILRKQDSEKR